MYFGGSLNITINGLCYFIKTILIGLKNLRQTSRVGSLAILKCGKKYIPNVNFLQFCNLKQETCSNVYSIHL